VSLKSKHSFSEEQALMTCGIKILANKSSIVRLERKLDKKNVRR